MESKKDQQEIPHIKDKNIILREGNIAYDIERPLFDTDSKIQLQKLKETYFQKISDESKVQELPPAKFLDEQASQDSDQETIILASYPRSGNTLLRAYLEKMMGLVTGSDCDIEKKLNKELMQMGLAGEGLVDKRVWIVKTHYPERYGKTKFYSERCIMEVRNPLDCVTSLFNMVCTGSHNKSIHNGDYQKFHEHWNEFIEQEISVWKDFHDFWLTSKIPVHIIRYEDILGNPKVTMMKLMKFVLCNPDLEGTIIEKYIDLTVKEKAPEIYKPRQGRANSNVEKFNREQLDFMFNYAKEQIVNFGYEESFTGNTLKSEYIDKYNQESLKKALFAANESDEITSIFINYPALLLRKKSMLYPDGRTSYRFKRQLRKKVTIIDKTSQHSQAQDETQSEDGKSIQGII